MNISADHLVCDLATFESMAQRFGRVNRFGIRSDTEIHVVYPKEFAAENELTARRKKTLDLLRQLNDDGSPHALGELPSEERRAAFSPDPVTLPTSDILFDAWALTTICGKLPGRPPVEPFLHGLAEWESPETHVAWREEVKIITGGLLDRYRPEDLLEEYPLKPHELLRDRSDRVFDQLQTLARRHPNEPVWVMDEQGQVVTLPLAKVADPSATQAATRKPMIARIEGCTVLLPPSVGGLSRGMLDGASSHADDVADIQAPASERRIRLRSNDEEYNETTKGMRLVKSIEVSQEDGEEEQPAWDWYKHKPLEDAPHRPKARAVGRARRRRGA